MENLSRSCSDSPFKHLRMERIDGRLLQSSASEKDAAAAAGHYKKKSRRKFVRLIKAVLFETSLMNRIKKRSKNKKKQSSNGDSPPVSEVDIQKKDTDPTINKKVGKKNEGSRNVMISSTPCNETTSSSSSYASSIASTSATFHYMDSTTTPAMDLKPKHESVDDGNIGGGYSGLNTGLCLVLVALLVLVVWGKLFAILCTSAWLIFVPNSRNGTLFIKGIRVPQSNTIRSLWRGLLDRKSS